MKKNRPGVLLTVLAKPEDLTKIQDVIFAETTSFGMRMQPMHRRILHREFREVTTPHGPVTIKLGLSDGKILQRAPEYESCRTLAAKSGLPIREIHTAALIAASVIAS